LKLSDSFTKVFSQSDSSFVNNLLEPNPKLFFPKLDSYFVATDVLSMKVMNSINFFSDQNIAKEKQSNYFSY